MKQEGMRILSKLNGLKYDLFGSTVVEIHCGTVTYICGCKKITVYTDKIIKMKCDDAQICFEGEELSLENLINGQLSLCGKIKKVEFIYD